MGHVQLLKSDTPFPPQTRDLYEIRPKNEKNQSNILTKLLHTPFIFVFLADEHL